MPDEDAMPPSQLSRRAFLAVCGPLVASCSRTEPDPPGPRPVEVPLDRVPAGIRVTVSVSGRPVEVLRTASGVTARLLLCTHQGCEVSWSEVDGVYACPCHDGKFDSEGRPIEGPPPRPLSVLPARVEGPLLLVGP